MRVRLVLVAALLTSGACSSSTSSTVDSVAGTDTTATVPLTTAASTSSTSEPSTTATATTSPMTAATTAPTTVPTTMAGTTPGVVTITYAGSGGGSGEIQIDWNAATGATRYRVYRATTPGGAFVTMANIDVINGVAFVHDGVVNVWGDRQTFIPGPYTGTGVSTQFHYVEVPFDGGGSHGYFRVIAYNDLGRGPIGATVCAQPFGVTAC